MAIASKDQKLDALLSAAARVFAERGYHQTSMRDLARASGVSLAGLYYYVESKEELLYLIQKNNFARVIAGMRERLEGATDPVDRLMRFIDNHLDYFAAHMAEMKVLSHEAGALSGEWLQTVEEMKRTYVRSLMDILAGIEEAHGPAHANRRVAAYSLFGMMNWIYNWYDPLGDLGVELLAQNIGRIFLGGYVGLPVAVASLPRTSAG
ncbi:MAG TPA: TetR/AcrR family transcriptional regulator [Gemmatimonadaceae bacterium]|nr:TetR/AcrR family transcriptional regulator [Gemmatimonadaceae bacterium]